MLARMRFHAELLRAGKTATGFQIPPEVVESLDAGRRPPVVVSVNGYTYRNTVAVMGGDHLVSVDASVREATGLEAGHPVTVALTVATTPRTVEVPDDLAVALAGDEQASAFFGALSNSLQRYHVDNVTAAKTAATRQRRVEKALALFREGKKR